MTQAQVQWFQQANNLQADVSNVRFVFDPNQADNASAFITALVSNPSNNPGIQVFSVEYTLFVDNSTNGFSVMGSSQVAISISTLSQNIPAKGNLNLSSTTRLMPDTVLLLHNFFVSNPSYSVWVLININLQSSYGTLALQSCFLQPSQLVPTCPAPRFSGGGGGGGGG